MKKNNPNKILIGIDPDVDKNGVAIINGDKTELHNLAFFELFDFFNEVLRQKGKSEEILVVIECGFLNKSNWHKDEKGSAAKNAKIGNNTGRNHEVAKKIVEMCEYLEIPHKKVRPTTSKLNAKLFKMVTKIEQRTNQEVRDAMMLIWGMK